MQTIGLVLVLFAVLVTTAMLVKRSRDGERRYRGLLEQLPSSTVVVFDRDLRIQTVLGAEVSAGHGGEPAGLFLSDVMPPESVAVLVPHYEAALTGEHRAFDFLSPITGKQLWIRAAPVRDGGEIAGVVVVAQDITDLRETERELTAETRRRRVMLDGMNEAYVASDDAGVVTEWNRAAELTFGWDSEEAIGRSLGELIIPGRDHRDLFALLDQRLPGQPSSGRHDLRAERTAVHRDGHEFTVELAATLVEIDGAKTLHALMHDISDRKLAERELRQHAADVESLADAVGELARSTDAQEARMAICRAAVQIADADEAILFEPDHSGSGLRASAAEGTDLSGALLPFTERSGAVAAFTSRELLFVGDVHSDPAISDSIRHRGTEIASAFWTPVRHDRDDIAVGVIAVAWKEHRDSLSERLERVMGVISAEAAVAIERAELLDRLALMARTDDLTGLTNRRAWDAELTREIVRAGRDESPLAIAMLDLDRFKDYNDRFGHQAGDRFLKEAAGAWREVLRETDLLARYGGEEFAVALPGCDREAAEDLVERLRAVTPGGESCSAGLVCWDGSETPDDLLGRADAALYEAKQSGRDQTILA